MQTLGRFFLVTALFFSATVEGVADIMWTASAMCVSG